MPTFRWSDLASEAIDPEHSAATGRVYRGEQIEVALVRYPAGSRVTPHASPHEQVHSILKGRARFRVGTEEKIIGPGEAVLVRSGVQHAAEILEELEVITLRDAKPDGAPAGTGGPAFYTWDAMAADFITPKYSSTSLARWNCPPGRSARAASATNSAVKTRRFLCRFFHHGSGK